ncbi:MAG TPA: acetylglutamate kinase [Kiritimatiellia bacterium]|nr:acetylglutamate kinase [Kiritimatiellia bacterium]HMO97591.1 acetylglutamate kinase [Kiritimatiellia bacterium]HMP96788.1 acetylglutamate kinase [Kiritimatiellia bacterium]
MQTLVEKASVLIEALPYIQRFRNDIVVVKFGGSSMEERAGVEAILKDVAFMACVGLRPVVVHGGGKAISARMKEAGIKSGFVKGLRVTDAASMDVVEQVLNREVNPMLVKALQANGCKARGIYGEDILEVVKHTEKDPDTGELLDWGYVGDVTDVDIEPILAFSNSHIVPIITPLGWGPDNKLYNINADDAASAIAVALKARKIVFMSDVPGLLRDPKDPKSLISTLSARDIDELIARKVIDGGMIPKVQGAVRALRSGVRKVHFVHAALPHSLLLELFTDQGVGTEIVE